MNIFSVLSTGKSRLHEPSMSAMLAYLLNPNQDHGLHRNVMDRFLELSNEKKIYTNFINNKDIEFEIDLEVAYTDKKRNDIDIQIKIFKSHKELHRIIIENKIKQGSANTKQLKSYYHAVINDKENDDPFDLNEKNLSVIFLTPPENKGLRDEFENLEIENKTWVFWNKENDKENTIVSILQTILKLEQEARISPINENMKHILKAFVYYVMTTINISSGNRSNIDYSSNEIKQEAEIVIDEETYFIVERKGNSSNSSMQIETKDRDRVQPAKPLFRKFLEERNVEIKGTTKTLGAKVFKWLKSNNNKSLSGSLI